MCYPALEEKQIKKRFSPIHQPKKSAPQKWEANVINVINDSETVDVDSSLEALMNGLVSVFFFAFSALIDKAKLVDGRWCFQFAGNTAETEKATRNANSTFQHVWWNFMVN